MLVQIVGPRDIGRKQLVHLVIEQEPLLFADLNKLADFVVLFFERQQLPPRVQS